MTVLVLSHMFPNELDSSDGVFVLEQVMALRKAGTTVLIVAPRPWAPNALRFLPSVRKYASITKQGIVQGMVVDRPAVPTLPKERGFAALGILYYLSCRHLVGQLFRQHKFDLIHAHTVMPDGFAAVLLGKEFNVPVVCTAHGSDVYHYPRRSRLIMAATRWALRRLGRLITVSRYLEEEVVRIAGTRQVAVIHNGADPAVFTPSSKIEARSRLGLDPASNVVSFVGYLRSEKALDDLLKGFASLARPDAKLCVLGDGPQRALWTSLAESLGISRSCMFLGARPHDEIPLWLSASDCLVLCSLNEGMPTVLPEAMLCRVPIVATPVGGIPEVIHDGDTGLLVPCRDPNAIATALSLLFSDPELSSRLVNRAEIFARNFLTWEANARRTLAIYEDAIRSSKPIRQKTTSIATSISNPTA